MGPTQTDLLSQIKVGEELTGSELIKRAKEAGSRSSRVALRSCLVRLHRDGFLVSRPSGLSTDPLLYRLPETDPPLELLK